jgi:hypothetical protein
MTQRELRDLVEYLTTLRTPATGADFAAEEAHSGHGPRANSGD